MALDKRSIIATDLHVIDAVRIKVKALRSGNRHSHLTRVAAFAYRHAKQWRTLVSLPAAIGALRASVASVQSGTPGSIDQAMQLAFNGAGGTIRPYQNESEIRQLLDLLARKKPQRILEIGTANGGTLFLFCRIADPNAVIVSVDLPGGWFGGGYPWWKRFLYHAFAGAGQTLHLLRADSHNEKTFEAVQTIVGAKGFDCIFIDGDHTYDGVSHDYEQYRTLLADEGLIGFHDIVPNRSDPDCQVPKFWQQLRSTGQTLEFIQDHSQEGAGIGVILPGDQSSGRKLGR